MASLEMLPLAGLWCLAAPRLRKGGVWKLELEGTTPPKAMSWRSTKTRAAHRKNFAASIHAARETSCSTACAHSTRQLNFLSPQMSHPIPGAGDACVTAACVLWPSTGGRSALCTSRLPARQARIVWRFDPSHFPVSSEVAYRSVESSPDYSRAWLDISNIRCSELIG